MHKHRNLVKLMMLVSTNGYIIDCFGPYLANGHNNDAKIFKKIVEDARKIQDLFKKDDIYIVDRGFRDILSYLESMGIDSKMPAFLDKINKQHSTFEANESHLVIKIRWIVEAVNGLIKKWKYFDNVVLNKYIKHIKQDFRFVYAIIN